MASKRVPIPWKDAKPGDFAVGNGKVLRLVLDGIVLNEFGSVRLIGREALRDLGFTCEREIKEDVKVWKVTVFTDCLDGSNVPQRLVRLIDVPVVSGDTLYLSTAEPLTFKEEE